MNSSQYPLSFEGNTTVFTLALFCTFFASLISIAQIVGTVKEIVKIPDKWKNPINIYRYQIILAYLSILIAVGPDSVYLWTYGEVTGQTTTRILNVDRFCDSLFLIPFLMFTWLHIRCTGVMKFQLLRQAIPVNIQPNFSLIKSNVLYAILIMFMSIGVALSK